MEARGASRRQPERGPRPGAPVAGGRPQREEGDRAQPAAPRRHPDPRSRAAHRRAVQQVGKRAGGPMSRIPFQKPKKVGWGILGDQYGRLVAEPFEKGYALTVGNSLRRTLLSIVPGAAVSWVQIDGVRNVDARIPGVTESTIDVLLNIRKLTVQVPSGEPKVLRLEVTGTKAVTGADVPETEVEIVNPDVPLFTLESATTVVMDLGVGAARGYDAADQKTSPPPAGWLALHPAVAAVTNVD